MRPRSRSVPDVRSWKLNRMKRPAAYNQDHRSSSITNGRAAPQTRKAIEATSTQQIPKVPIANGPPLRAAPQTRKAIEATSASTQQVPKVPIANGPPLRAAPQTRKSITLSDATSLCISKEESKLYCTKCGKDYVFLKSFNKHIENCQDKIFHKK